MFKTERKFFNQIEELKQVFLKNPNGLSKTQVCEELNISKTVFPYLCDILVSREPFKIVKSRGDKIISDPRGRRGIIYTIQDISKKKEA